MTERKQILSELQDVIYNSEDLIDGEYNSEDEKFSDLTEINNSYNKLLIDMNKIVDLIDIELRKNE